jgi:hypothetical protein
MENSQLTESQIKTLKLFSYYVKSYGKRFVSTTKNYYDGSGDYHDEGWWSGTKTIDSYKEIDEVINSIIESNDLEDEMDVEGHSRLEVTIDSDENSIEIKSFKFFMESREMGDDKEITELSGGDEFIEYSKSNEITEGRVDFSGGGDSGDIYSNMDIPRGNSVDVPSNIMDSLYGWLESFYGGWEINEGSQGSFNFHFDEGKVYLTFYENYEESEEDTVFESKF